MNMKRTNFYFPAPMLAKLKAISKKTGTPISELIRTAVRNYLHLDP